MRGKEFAGIALCKRRISRRGRPKKALQGFYENSLIRLVNGGASLWFPILVTLKINDYVNAKLDFDQGEHFEEFSQCNKILNYYLMAPRLSALVIGVLTSSGIRRAFVVGRMLSRGGVGAAPNRRDSQGQS